MASSVASPLERTSEINHYALRSRVIREMSAMVFLTFPVAISHMMGP